MKNVDFLMKAIEHLLTISIMQVLGIKIPVEVEVIEPKKLPPKMVKCEVKFLENSD